MDFINPDPVTKAGLMNQAPTKKAIPNSFGKNGT